MDRPHVMTRVLLNERERQESEREPGGGDVVMEAEVRVT